MIFILGIGKMIDNLEEECKFMQLVRYMMENFFKGQNQAEETTIIIMEINFKAILKQTKRMVMVCLIIIRQIQNIKVVG